LDGICVAIWRQKQSFTLGCGGRFVATEPIMSQCAGFAMRLKKETFFILTN
jgi:hypothetical protein